MKIKKAELVWRLNEPKCWYVQVDEPTQVVHVVDGEVKDMGIWARNPELIAAAKRDLRAVGYQLAPNIIIDILPTCDT